MKAITALLFTTCLVLSAHAEEQDLFIVAGQSNAVGFDACASQLPADPGDKDVMFWFRCGDPPPDDHDTSSARQWTTLRAQPVGNPLPKKGEGLPPRQYGNFGKPEGGFGPEIGFARALRAMGAPQFAIVKAAFSGTGMRTDWNQADPGPQGACYRALIEEVKAARAAAKEKGITLKPRALLWVQGESDANPKDAPNYDKALGAMIEALRKDIDAPKLLALIAVNPHFGNDKNPHMPVVVERQKALAARDPLCVYVDTETAETLQPSQTHFTAAGTLDVGKRFAEALAQKEKGAAK